MLFRNLLFYFFLIPCIMVTTPLLLCTPYYKWRYKIIQVWSDIFVFLAKTILGLNYKIEGAENIPNYPTVIICNHQSMWETIFLQVVFPHQTWIMKRELFWIPFFGLALKLLDPIAINRSDKEQARKILYEKGTKKLHSGYNVVIFPEGTRVAPGIHKKFSKSGTALAITAAVPIIPIAHNAGVFWPRGFFCKKPGTIAFFIGKPISTQGETLESLSKQVETIIRNKMQEMLIEG